MFPKLFEHGRIGSLEMDNRIVKAATYLALCNPDGSVTDRLLKFYREIARGGTGLVIVECAWVDKKASKAAPCQLGVADIEHIPGLAALAQAISEQGAKSALQIAHFGRDNFLPGSPAKAPSRIPMGEESSGGGFLFESLGEEQVPDELTIEEIREIIAAFGNAAKRAQNAGFDMVEVYGCHGGLITNFLSPATNRRTDLYGGSLQSRMRFLLEVVRDVRRKVGPDFPIGVRLSGTDYEVNGVVLKETLEVAKVLEKVGVDIIHVSGGSHTRGNHLTSPMSVPAGYHVAAAAAIKKAVRIPVIASGSITTPELAEEILEGGKADYISLARPLFADPCWPQKAREGRPEDIIPCIRCNDGCQDRTNLRNRPILCSVNVALGRGDTFAITPAEKRKTVAIVGGGPGGMEAARVCALRGHKVVLYEKRKLGGTLNEGSAADFKSDIKRLINYFTVQMEKLKVEVIQKEATANTIMDGSFDAVIVAVGGKPFMPDIPGIDKPHVFNALDVFSGKSHVGQKVLVVGGNMVGAEVGLWLAEQGKEVVFVEMLDEFMANCGHFDRLEYHERLAKRKVTIYTGRRVKSVVDKGAVIVDRYGKKKEIHVDSIVFSTGLTPQTTLKEQLEKRKGPEIHAIGDCVFPRRIFDAVYEGHMAARKI